MTSLFCKREMAAKRGNEVRAEINVSEFLNTLKKLSSDKVTDRKAAQADLKRLLDREDWLEFIDECSRVASPKRKGKVQLASVTWERLLSVASQVALREYEAQKKVKKELPGQLFKLVIRAGNRRSPQIPLKIIVDHIVQALHGNNPERRECFAVEYSNILLKDVLVYREYRNALGGSSMYSELILLYFEMYSSSLCQVDRALLTAILQKLVLHGALRTNLPLDRLFVFLRSSMADVIHEKDNKSVEGLLALANTFITASRASARQRICALGEPLLNGLIGMWKRCQPAMRRELLTFLQLQLSVHFPCGRVGQDGAWAVDGEAVKKGMVRLHQTIVDELDSMAFKLRWSSKGESLFDKELVEMAADTFRVVNRLLCSPSDVDSHCPPAGKRPKLLSLSGWDMFAEQLSKNQDNPSIVVWLQILSRTLTLWAEDFPLEEFTRVLEVLHKMEAEVKRPEVVGWTVKCLTSAALCHGFNVRNLKWKQHQMVRCATLWSLIWSCTIRILNVHSCEEEGFQLLTAMLKAGIAQNTDHEVWKLFVPGFSPCSSWHIAFLTEYLRSTALPEDCGHGVTSSSQQRTRFVLRNQLIQFLLPVEELDEVTGRRRRNDSQLHERSSPVDLALVLVALTQRTCSVVNVVQCSCQWEDREDTFADKGSNGRSQIENLYLASTFDDKPPLLVPNETMSKSHDVHMEKPVPCLCSSLLARLDAVALELLKQAEQERSLQPGEGERMLMTAELIKLQAHHCSLIVLSAYLLLLCNHEEGSGLTDLPAVKKLTLLLDSIVKGLKSKEWSDMESKTRHQLVASILNNLMPMFTSGLCFDLPLKTADSAATISGLIAECVPKGLVDVVEQIAKGKWFPPSKDSQQGEVGAYSADSSVHTSNSSTSMRNHDGFDLMDVDSRLPTTSMMKSGESTSAVKGMVEMHSPSSLDAYDRSSVCAVKLLVTWLKGALQVGGTGLLGPAVSAAHHVLLSMLSAQSLNLADPHGVQVVLSAAELLECRAGLNRTDLEAVLDGIRNLLAAHSRDPTVSACCLTALQSSARHLAALGEPSSEYCTELCQKLLSAFWTFYREGHLSPSLRLKLVECVHAYLLVDPASSWMVISQRRRKKERDVLPPGDATLAVSLKDALLSFLKDSDHQVCMKVARLIPVLFQPVITGCDTTQHQPLSRSAQEALFAAVMHVFSTPPEALDTEMDRLSEEDESFNNMSSRLATFQSIMAVSSACECPVLWTVLTALGRRQVELSVVNKMLCQVAMCLGYTTKEKFLEEHLVSMVTKWLSNGFSIGEFPCRLLGIDQVKDFLLKYSKQVIPVMVWRNDRDALRVAERLCATSSQELLKGSLSRCMLVVLTTYASQKEGLPVDAGKMDQASVCHDLLSEYFGEEELSSLLRESMDDFLVELLTSIYEDNNTSSDYLKYFLPSDPEPNPPYFTSRLINTTLCYVSQCYGLQHSSLVATLSKTKDSLQNILLSLSLKLCLSHCSHNRRRLLVSFLLFVQLIAADLHTGLGGSMPYLVHTIIHFTLNCIASERKRMKPHDSHMTGSKTMETGKHCFMLCFDILKVIYDAAVSVAPEEVSRHVPLIVSSVLSVAESNLLVHAAPLLHSLCTSCVVSPLNGSLAQADPIPAEGELQELAAVQSRAKQHEPGRLLQDDIAQLMSKEQSNTAVSTVDSLKRLRERLREEREEAARLISADVMSESHETVVQLLQYLLQRGKKDRTTEGAGESGSEYEAVIAECGRCLGELGCVDLKQVALPEPSRSNDCTAALATMGLPPNEVHTARVLNFLCDLLVDKDIEVVKASCDSLKAILATFQGDKVLSQLEKRSHDPHMTWCCYLEPFKGRKKGKATAHDRKWHDVEGEGSARTIGRASLWNPWGGLEKKEYGSWLTQLVLFLLRGSSCVADPVLLQLTPIASIKVEMCELVFPFIMYDVLVNGGEDCRKLFSDSFRDFFTAACSAPLEDTRPVLLMVRIIMYLRTVPRSTGKKSRSPPTAWDNNFWLDIDYLSVSKATQRCSLHLTSLLCLEIAVGEMEENGASAVIGDDPPMEQPGGVASGCLTSTSPVISSGPHANDIHSLLVDIYSNIGEPDGLYGVYSIFGSANSSRENKLKMYEHEGQWLRALGGHALEMNGPVVGSGAREGLVKALHSLGWYSLSEMHTFGAGRQSRVDELKNLREYQFEVAWRNTLWEEREGDQPLPSHQPPSTPSFAHCIFSGVEAVRTKSLFQLDQSVMMGRSSVFASWLEAGESTSLLYPVMSKLQSLLEVEETAQILAGQREVQGLLLPWKQRLPMMDADYRYVEPVLALRCVLLRLLLNQISENGVADTGGGGGSASTSGTVEELYSTLGATLLWQAELARKAGQYQLAESAIFSMSKLAPPPGVGGVVVQEVQWGQQLEEVQLHWALGETSLALQTLRDTTQRLEQVCHDNTVAMQLYPRALCLYGSWLAETRTENPNVILAKYLQPAVDLIDTLASPSPSPNCVLPPEKAYITLARYADRQYQGIVHYMQSNTFEAKKELLRKSKKEAAELSKTAGERSEASRHLRQLHRHSEEDQAELEALVEDKTRFLHIAVKNYILCLKAGDDNNLCVFRLCSLWFDNCNDKVVNELLKESVSVVESRKFLPLLYQLAARMSKKALEGDPFQQVLQEIILYTAKDHPHHSLYIILAMGNATKDDEYPLRGYVCGSRKGKSRRAGTGGGGGSHSVDEDKVQAAKALVAKLRSAHGPLVRSTERLCEAYIELAYHDSSVDRPKNTQGLPLPINSALSKLGKLDGVAIPTLNVPVDSSCCYDRVIQIEGFDSSYMLAGGMNVPKVLTCIGSDGIRRRQLLKGRDDLRQDAVMQQVFGLVNQLLKRDCSAVKRKLHIRTYNVVPLSQRSGIVEWCEGTVPLGDYLVHPRTGAHLKYRPHDWPSKVCRQKMEASKTCGRSDKVKAFKAVMSHFKPVFRHFFFEKFPSPSQWFECRLAYTRSVATSSIVGYIVGLGDRHVQNILVDTNSAEVIHIDLGVAFEQGRTLPTPEKVPFRLTRDIIDGMGVCGIEGVFRRCCEEILNTMKASQEEVKTIVEVLLHDPLYMWTITPKKMMLVQQPEKDVDLLTALAQGVNVGGGAGGNLTELDSMVITQKGTSASKMAERALFRLKEKLDGYEDGIALSTSGQVNFLLQSATDIVNLSSLFPGWQAWV